MSTLISIAIILVCILLILIVLVQNSKGGGLASSFSSSNQVMGVRKTADFLEKATWSLAGALLVLSLLSAAYNQPGDGTNTAKTTSSTRTVGANKADEGAGSSSTALPIKTDSTK
ncbi:MAG: preprotein translocase, SecG subunit [Bacteroidetes bacterium]|nr:preprotein translocase, SecG subunit [Bacteroidota bacterium]